MCSYTYTYIYIFYGPILSKYAATDQSPCVPTRDFLRYRDTPVPSTGSQGSAWSHESASRLPYRRRCLCQPKEVKPCVEPSRGPPPPQQCVDLRGAHCGGVGWGVGARRVELTDPAPRGSILHARQKGGSDPPVPTRPKPLIRHWDRKRGDGVESGAVADPRPFRRGPINYLRRSTASLPVSKDRFSPPPRSLARILIETASVASTSSLK